MAGVNTGQQQRTGKETEKQTTKRHQKALEELQQRLQFAHAARDAAQEKQKEHELQVVRMDAYLADLRNELELEKAARAPAALEIQQACQGRAAATHQVHKERVSLQAEVKGLKQQLAAAMRQQDQLQQQLSAAQQQSRIASADNVALRFEIQATQQQLVEATGGAVVHKERLVNFKGYNVVFRQAVSKMHIKRAEAEAQLEEVQKSSEATIKHLRSIILKLQKMIDRTPEVEQDVNVEQIGQSGLAAAAKQHKGEGAAAKGDSSAAEILAGPAAAFKGGMGPGRNFTTLQAGGGSRQQGKVAVQPAASQASSARPVAHSRATAESKAAPARRKVTQPMAVKTSSAQVMGRRGPSTSGGIVTSGARPMPASLPTGTMKAAGGQLKAQPPQAITGHGRLAAKPTGHERPAEARDSLLGTKRKRVDCATSDSCNTTQRQKLEVVGNSQVHRQREGCIKAWK